VFFFFFIYLFCLRLVSLDCPLLIARSVFYKVYYVKLTFYTVS